MKKSRLMGVSRACILKKTKSLILASLAIGGFVMTLSAAQAATVVWDFNLPATSTSSQTPPYPSAATLTLVDTGGGVQFTLDPNELNPGYEATSTVNSLNIIFTRPNGGTDDLPSSAYQWISGPVANADTFGNTSTPLVAVVMPPASAMNMDSSYKSANGQLLLTWDNFNVTGTSVWTIAGTTIADNFSIMATSNSNPSPTFGIFSVSPISLDGITPTPSNWVTGPAPVPVPAAAWLFGSGLMGLVGIARRKKAA